MSANFDAQTGEPRCPRAQNHALRDSADRHRRPRGTRASPAPAPRAGVRFRPRGRSTRLREALEWASKEARGRLPDWFHATLAATDSREWLRQLLRNAAELGFERGREGGSATDFNDIADEVLS